MDDINKSISEILADPKKMEMLQGMASQLFGENKSASPPPPQSNTGGIEDIIGNAKGISNLISAFNGANFSAEDDSVRLLLALRPHLKAERQLRVDTAVKILKLIRLAPILKSSGLINF
ncbi:MAG: hypothetical protein IJN65_05710 [Clostridia bacterium]|nr:hypothetical protein [Clostridia bacterium]